MSGTAKITPRQKMINLIYLVLTAILALNVSSEVLDAFKTVNDGIGISNTSLRSKNSDLYTDLGKEFHNDSIKARLAFDRSQKVKELSAKLFSELEQYKRKMIEEAGGVDPVTGKIKRDDDLDIATRIFVEKEGKEGKQLKQEIETTRKNLLALVDEEQRPEIEKSLALKIDEPADGKTWEFARFNQVPVVAAVTLLSKYQNDLLNAESHVIENLYSSIDKGRHKVDRMEAKIISPSSYIMQGESYRADVMVAAYSSTQHPDVFLGQFNSGVHKDFQGNYLKITTNSDAPPLINPVKVDVDGGFGKIQLPGSATGNKKYTGVVRVKNDGNYEYYPFDGEYQVAPKVAVVSPTKMNVLYIGLDNPVDISVPGVAQSDVTATFEGNGTLVKNPDGSYKAQVNSPGTTKVKVSAKINGKMLPMGEQNFRIKRVPNPLTTVDGVMPNGGSTTVSFIKDRRGVVAKSDDFIYGDVQWQVLSYTMIVVKGTDVFKVEVAGPLFSQKAKDMLKQVEKGNSIFFEDVWVKGPDNQSRKISPLAYKIMGK